MLIDTSVVISILQMESDSRALLEVIENSDTARMSVVSFVEASFVIGSKYGMEGLRDLDLFIARAGVELVPVDAEQAYLAREAFTRFGKGRHRAALNFGDCFSYAAAMALGEPLLYKGEDFAQTDVLSLGPAENQ